MFSFISGDSDDVDMVISLPVKCAGAYTATEAVSLTGRAGVSRLRHTAFTFTFHFFLAFCNTGHWAATDWFVLSEVAGFDNIAKYDGSMAAWTVSDSRPVQLAREGIKQVRELLN